MRIVYFIFIVFLLLFRLSPAAETSGELSAVPPGAEPGSSAQSEPESQPDEETMQRASFLLTVGSLYASEGELEEAERAYLRALEELPGNPDIRFRLSTLYIQMERYKTAEALLQEMIAEFPDNPLIHNNLAWVYATGGAVRSGRLALHHAREAVLLAPVQPSMWNTLAEAYFVSGQYELARRSSVHAFDLLQSQQNTTEQDLQSFRAQYDKINRAEAAYKRFMGIDEE